jgi:diguanylate cyclase (GGDEF)-like protein/PAS domain S-box-containing protein
MADVASVVVLPGGREPQSKAARRARAADSAMSLAVDADHDGWADRSLLLDHIADAVFATDEANRITQWTASAAHLFGFSASEAIGRPFSELLSFLMDGPGREMEMAETLAAGLTWHGTGTVRLRDERVIWLGSSVEPIIVQGRLVGSVSVSRDMTAIHEAQQKLALSEQFISTVLDVVGALVVVLDPQGRMLRFNAACELLSGYRYEEVLGLRIWDMLVPLSEIAQAHAVVSDLQAGVFPNTSESHWLTRTGGLRLISWVNTCVTDDMGQVTHVIATGVDITESRRRHEALRALETIGRLLAEQEPVPSALDAVLGEMQARMGYPFLALYVSEGSGLQLAAHRGHPAISRRVNADASLVDRVYRTGRAEFIPDGQSEHGYESGPEDLASEIAVPLLGGEAVLGVLIMVAGRGVVLAHSDLQLAKTIADRLSSALRRSRSQEALRERTRLFSAVAEFAAAVNATREPGRLATILVDAVIAVIPSDTVVITTLDRSDGQYRVTAVRGLSQDAVGTIIEPGDGTAGRAISERATVLTEPHPRAEFSTALREFIPYEMIRSSAIPLINEGTVLGVISMGRADAGASFTAPELEVFALLGAHAALALANAYLVEEVSALAIRDGLTGLYNRRHFDAALDLAIARYKRRGPPSNLAAIMFDVDHFGDFNRNHGHPAGDAALRLFSEVLQQRSREADVVARYGGEEFVLILEDCGLPEAARRAEEIRRELEVRTVPGADGPPLQFTVSAGCAVIDPACPTGEALIGTADSRLFLAKRNGRNQVVAADKVSRRNSKGPT